MDKDPSIPYEEKVDRPPIRRAERRKIQRSKSLARELLKIVHSYFPDLIKRIRCIEDPRYKNYTTFDISVLIIERVLAAIFSTDSMRSQTEDFNDENMIKNIAMILNDDLSELPHHDTINNCFKKLKPSELEKIIQQMIVALTRRNTFNESRVRGKYWQVLVDATTLCGFKKRHCEKCLFKRHKNKKGEVTSIEYYHYVLEAKLVLHENLVFSICTEFIENEDGIPSEAELLSPDFNEPSKERFKQDCEIKAFYRLSEKLKSAFPRLPICLTADGLYPCKQVFKICRDNKWRFIMRFKEGCVPSLYNEYTRVKESSLAERSFHVLTGEAKLDYFYANGLTYDDYTLNFAECQDNTVDYPFLFVTDFPIDRNNCESTVGFGRRRWRIENEGFKVQKNHGFHLKHIFCEDYNAMKIHYFLIQIAHAISQLLEHGSAVVKTLNLSSKEFHKYLKTSFARYVLTEADIAASEEPQKIRLAY